MDKYPWDVQAVQSALASWNQYVVRTHTQSLHIHRTMYESFLSQQAAAQEALLRLISGTDTVDTQFDVPGGCKFDVNESFVTSVLAYWQEVYQIGPGLIRDFYLAICVQFLNTLVFEDEETLNCLMNAADGVLFLANHQTAVESSLFSIILGGLLRRPIVALSKIEHSESWVGRLIQLISDYPNVQTPKSILYVDQQDHSMIFKSFQTLLRMVKEDQYSGLIHGEGTRVLRAGLPVSNISSALVDLAFEMGVTIVPVWFSGGLPVEKSHVYLDYPIGFGSQDIRIGRPIDADTLRRVPSTQRKQFVLKRLNRLAKKDERPNPPNPALENCVTQWRQATSIAEENLPLISALELLKDPSEETVSLLRALAGQGRIDGITAEQRWLKSVEEFFLTHEAHEPITE